MEHGMIILITQRDPLFVNGQVIISASCHLIFNMLFSKYFFNMNVYVALSSIVACGPGSYKEKTDAFVKCLLHNHNSGQRHVCLPCPGETIKPNTGDSDSCPEDCEEDSKVANAEHTACGEFPSLCYSASTIMALS